MGMEFEGVHNEVVKAGASLLGGLIKDTAQGITSRIDAARASKDKDKTINSLEEIINELISDRNQLIQAVQAYQEVLITQKISDAEIDYITQNIFPLLEELIERNSGEDADKMRETLQMMKPLLSKELFSIAQLLGFNFRQAIGEPLTKLVNSLITSKSVISSETNAALQIAMANKEAELFKFMQDEQAVQKMSALNGQERV
ncbi:hypothetical protein [Paenibacillus pabuli]|uniref:hypothetical protein n=1 Tax=Paenibacillus pabuli TaxID=1472 RepID=UPI0007843884|nr:hypothetical protein [Paenibacillus pabuli]MEC0125330.1 hypothetical protein [Paenibacillus pabuli]